MALRVLLTSLLAVFTAFFGRSSSSAAPIRVTPLALVGQQVPGVDPSLTIGVFNGWRSIDNTGRTIFGVQLAGPNVTPGDRNSIWYGTPGSLKVIARDNDPAPDTNGLRFHSVYAASASPDGDVAFSAGVSGSGTNSTNYFAIWAGPPESLKLAARAGWQAPATPPNTRYRWLHPGGVPLFGDGALLLIAQLEGPDVTEQNDAGLWSGPPTNLRLLAREGEQAFGFPEGIVYDQLDYGLWGGPFLPPPSPSTNKNGLVLFSGPVRRADQSWQSGSGLWIAGPEGVNSAIRTGDPAPGFPPDHTFGGFEKHRITLARPSAATK